MAERELLAMEAGSHLIPYSENDDLFIERASNLSGRLHLDPFTGHARFEPLPSDDDLAEFYNGEYVRPFKSDVEREFNPHVIKVAEGLKEHMRSVAKFDDSFTTHDIGCGYGALTYGFRAIGIKATGNEINSAEVEAGNAYCGGVLSRKPLAEALDDLGYEVDLFTALHVLEHFVDPLSTLKCATGHLSDRGVVYICVPNGHSLQAMLGGRRKDPCYNFPGHLQYFTPKSLVAMVLEAGLEPVVINTRALPHMEGGMPGMEALLGVGSELVADPASWDAAIRANLLGYELHILASKPQNTSIAKESNIRERAEKAHQFFLNRSPFEALGVN